MMQRVQVEELREFVSRFLLDAALEPLLVGFAREVATFNVAQITNAAHHMEVVHVNRHQHVLGQAIQATAQDQVMYNAVVSTLSYGCSYN